jgi:ABC-type phosphate transport system substrate-binding protein
LKRFRVLVPVLVLLAGASEPSVGADTGVRVIVNPQVKGNQITRTALTKIFLKQAPSYGDGLAAQPVDQSVKSPVRSAFSNRVLGQALIEVQVYWQRRMSQGVAPPPVRTTDEEVVAFVAQTPGAIGYVSSAIALPETVRSIEVAN